MIKEAPTVRLDLESRPESLTLVRGAIAGLGDALALETELLEDIRTAVSEACNNVILHAYDGEPGPLSVDLTVEPARVDAVVYDRGSGIHGIAPATDRIGIGLALISSLAERAEFLTRPEGGTEVRMSFTGHFDWPEPTDGQPPDGADWPAELYGDTVVRVFPLALLGGVLGRMLRAVAARAHFSVDRLSDLYLLGDELGVYARTAAKGEKIGFALNATPRRIELRLGPFHRGSCAELKATGSDGATRSPLLVLADELTAEPSEQSEMLRVRVRDAGVRTAQAPAGRALDEAYGIAEAREFLDDAYRNHALGKDHSTEHPIAVAQLLHDQCQRRDVVLAGLLHDVLEDTSVSSAELRLRFGDEVTDLVEAVTQDASIAERNQRKAALRDQVLAAGPDAAAIALADKTAKLQRVSERPAEPGLEHYRKTLTGIERRYGRSDLSELLRQQLSRWPGGVSGPDAGSAEAQ